MFEIEIAFSQKKRQPPLFIEILFNSDDRYFYSAFEVYFPFLFFGQECTARIHVKEEGCSFTLYLITLIIPEGTLESERDLQQQCDKCQACWFSSVIRFKCDQHHNSGVGCIKSRNENETKYEISV